MLITRRSLFAAAAAAPVVLSATAEAQPPDPEPRLLVPKRPKLAHVGQGMSMTVYLHDDARGLSFVGVAHSVSFEQEYDYVAAGPIGTRQMVPGIPCNTFTIKGRMLDGGFRA